jgi:hypothetical protein
MSQSPRLDNRFMALRAAGLDLEDVTVDDDQVREFIRLRDEGADRARIAYEMTLDPDAVDELIRADESYAVAHRIAAGEEPMYPVPEPDQRVVDARAGSLGVPVAVLILVLAGVIVYGLLR